MTTFPRLPQPVLAEERFLVPATLDLAAGRAAVEQAVKKGVLKPSDIDRVRGIEPALLYVPFWRVAVTVDGFHVGVATVQNATTGRTLPIPTGGARHKDAVVMVCARGVVPYVSKLPSFLQNLGGAPAIELGLEEMVPLTAGVPSGEVVDADIDRARAESMAAGMLLRAVRPSNAIYAKYDPRIVGSHFCLYPLYYTHYRYDGEARRHGGEDCFVAVSGRTGQVVAAAHPSAVRAVAVKLRRLLSFDFR